MAMDFPLPRELLAGFLKDERTIRAFEQLGDTVNESVDIIAIVQAVADSAYFLGFAAAGQGQAPFPDMLLAAPEVGAASDFILPIPDASPMLPKLGSGTYTPTLTNGANVAASTAYAAQWSRVGDVVTVSGKVDIDPTGAALTTLGISLPIASDLGSQEQCAGTGSAAIGTMAGAVLADVASNIAAMQFYAVTFDNAAWFYTFTYRVI